MLTCIEMHMPSWKLVRTAPNTGERDLQWAVSVFAEQDIAAGEAACISYAPDLPGSYFLYAYGFVYVFTSTTLHASLISLATALLWSTWGDAQAKQEPV